MLRVFRNRARLFVTLGWVLSLVSIPVCLVISASAGFDKFYFPAHQDAPLDAFDIKASGFILTCGAFAAVASSLALALEFRAAASVLVVAIWSAAILGTQGARLFVKPGPEYFERHLGQRVYLIPWQYAPLGPGESAEQHRHENGFSANLCLSNLKGSYDQGCRDSQHPQLSVSPKDFEGFDIEFWRKYRSQMSAEPERSGYQSYAYSFASGPTRVEHYYVRQDSEGRVTRLVVCSVGNEDLCSHHAQMANYWISYVAPVTEGDALDGKLEGLVESWRRK